MQSNRSVIRNFLALGSGEALSRIIAFVATIYIARVLGADGYGVIAFAVGVNLYLSKIADFAIEWVGSKEIAAHRDSLKELTSALMGARLALALVLTGISVLVVQFLMPDPERYVLELYFLTMIPIAASTKWVHMGLEDARPVGLARVLGEALGLAIVLLVMSRTAGLWVPPLAQIASESLVALLLFYILRKRGYHFGLTWDMDRALPVFRAAFPLLVHIMLGLFIYNSDLIFLRVFRDSEQVGLYAAAYTLISFLSNLGMSYGMSLLPTLTRQGTGTAEEKALYHTALAQVYAISFPVSVGGCLLASDIITLSFGDQYTGSVLALQVLIWSIPLSIFRYVPWAALIGRERQDLLMRVIFYGALANIALNCLLIPFYGMLGAAAATVVTECLVGIVMLRYAANESLPFVSYRRLWRSTVAGLCMGAVLYALHGRGLPVGLLAGIAAYGAVLTILGGIKLQKGQLPALNV
ncbi:MAG: flippase [Gammaproteobacteria bacterium]|jgi:O-antigen/teichoic acid export membrane protein